MEIELDRQPGLLWLTAPPTFGGDEAEAVALMPVLAQAGGPGVVPGSLLLPPGRMASWPVPDSGGRSVRLRAVVPAPVPLGVTVVQSVDGDLVGRVQQTGVAIARTALVTDSLPAGWAGALGRMNQVWVRTTFEREALLRGGVGVPVHTVPPLVDTAAYCPELVPWPLAGRRGTVFLAAGEWRRRDGLDLVIAAWAEAFGPDDDVTLVIRSEAGVRSGTRSGATGPGIGGGSTGARGSPTGSASGGASRREIDAVLASIGRRQSDVAPIQVLEGSLPESGMPRLFNAADVVVSAARGGGGERALLEAMACARPVIAPRWGGRLDFLCDAADDVAGNACLVDIVGAGVGEQALIDGSLPGREVEVPPDDLRWADPDVAHLASLLVRLASSPAERTRLGAEGRRQVDERWSRERTAALIVERLGEEDHSTGQGEAPGTVRPSDRPALPVQVTWAGDIFAYHSLAVVSREMVTRLVASGRVVVEPVTPEQPPYPEDSVAALAPVARQVPLSVKGRSAKVEVRHAWPPDLSRPRTGKLVVMQPWEFGGIPAPWIEPMSTYVDEVWAYTSWVRECYVKSGVPEDKVFVVPLGVDTDRFTPEGDRYPITSDRTFNFLFLGGATARKGVDLLLNAYQMTFTADDDVCLVMKLFGGKTIYRNSAFDEVLRALEADRSAPRIELIDEELTVDQIASLYRRCDALVHPYRGEGFGLPIAEAMASALPVIATDYGACLDFCDAATTELIPAAVVPMTGGLELPSSIGYWWAEPDVGVLGEIMRKMVANPEPARERGREGRRRIIERFTWDHSAMLVEQRLLSLAG